MYMDWILRVLGKKGKMSLDKELFIRLEIHLQDKIYSPGKNNRRKGQRFKELVMMEFLFCRRPRSPLGDYSP